MTGASRGIGQATAIRLARDFDAIVLVARIRHRLRESATLVEAKGAKALSIEIDLAGRPAKLVVEQRLSAFGRVDALLNVAGAVPQIDLFEMTVEPWDGGRSAT